MNAAIIVYLIISAGIIVIFIKIIMLAFGIIAGALIKIKDFFKRVFARGNNHEGDKKTW